MEIYVIQKSDSVWKNNSSNEILTFLSTKNNWGIPYYLNSGKPMLTNAYISVSHSHELCVIAHSNRPIGIDCELIRPIEETLIDKLKLDKINPILDWCKRESVIKLMDDKQYLFKKELNEFFFEEVSLNPKFCIVISSQHKLDSYEIIILDEKYESIPTQL